MYTFYFWIKKSIFSNLILTLRRMIDSIAINTAFTVI